MKNVQQTPKSYQINVLLPNTTTGHAITYTNEFTLQALVSLLNQPGVSTPKTGGTKSLLIDQEWILKSFEKREENKAHTHCLLGSYCAI